jgi:hypothetical protein
MGASDLIVILVRSLALISLRVRRRLSPLVPAVEHVGGATVTVGGGCDVPVYLRGFVLDCVRGMGSTGAAGLFVPGVMRRASTAARRMDSSRSF